MKFPVAIILGATLTTATAAAFITRGNFCNAMTRSGVFNKVLGGTSSRAGSTAAYASPAEFAKAEIAANDVVVFSKSYCPFCTSTKQLLNKMNIDAKVYELDNMDNGADIQSALLDISGQRTVPNVFVKGKHLGGNDDTQAAARSGKLEEMLK
mmetsp:Transcript_327/g.766  ORF Transcript_327/g.766 Transcript_327/m.766 type:complete len:153 (+) Transcript_327:119-577(+)